MAMKDPQLGTIYLSEYEAPRFLIDKTVLCIDVRSSGNAQHEEEP